MIKFDKEKCEIVVTECFSWSNTVLPLIKAAKEYYGELYEDEELPDGVDASDVEEFLNWNAEEDEATPTFESTKEDIMEAISESMNNAEWGDCFNSEDAVRDALADWISDEFSFDFDKAAFPDYE